MVAAVYDWLLFLHVLAAFLLVGTIVVHSAVVLGAPAPARSISIGNLFWNVGGLGTLILGVWLALYVKGYEVWDGWILGAIVLWVAATGLGSKAQAVLREGGGRLARWHWLRTIATVGILVLMIWKPGA
jgi:hypothetical protein